MEWTTQDPNGFLNAGSRWTKEFSTSKTVRVVLGVIVSSVREDDLIVWATEQNDGITRTRPYSGRRTAFNHWEPAKAVQFEVGHTYRPNTSTSGTTFLVMHVFKRETEDRGARVIALRDGEDAVNLYQSERGSFEDITGETS